MPAQCKENVGRGIVSFPCTLDPGHDGPHMAIENLPSVHARRAWDEAVALEDRSTRPLPHPGAEPLTVFQGPAQTSQMGLLEHGAPIPTVDTSAPGAGVIKRGSRPETVWAGEPTTVRDEAPTTEEWIRTVEEVLPAAEAAVAAAETLKLREGDQPLPTVRQGVESIQSLVISDIAEREQVGISRYGTALQSFNGRDADRDLYEELLDATMYQRQKLEERKALFEALLTVTARIESLLGSLPLSLEEPLQVLFDGLHHG